MRAVLSSAFAARHFAAGLGAYAAATPAAATAAAAGSGGVASLDESKTDYQYSDAVVAALCLIHSAAVRQAGRAVGETLEHHAHVRLPRPEETRAA